MRFLTFILTICLAFPALAENSIYVKKQEPKAAQTAPKTSKDFANAYYKNCRKQQHEILRGEELELLCACTAAKFAETFTPEQAQIMITDTNKGLLQRNRMLLFVYAPCIEFPTRALVMSQCLGDAKVNRAMRKPQQTCSCLADGVAGDLKERAPDIIRNAVRMNPRDLDPLSMLMNSNAFETRMRYHTSVCVQRHELGIQ